MPRLILVLIIGLTCLNAASQGKKGKGKGEKALALDPACITCLVGSGISCITTCLTGVQACLACITGSAPQCLAVCGFGKVAKLIAVESERRDHMDPCVQANTNYPVRPNEIISITRNVANANACGIVCRGVDQNILAGWVYANANEPNINQRFTCLCVNFIGTPIRDFTRDSGVGRDCPPQLE